MGQRCRREPPRLRQVLESACQPVLDREEHFQIHRRFGFIQVALRRVRHLHDLGQSQEPGIALDGVQGAAQLRQGAFGRFLFQGQQVALDFLQPVVLFSQVFPQQLLVGGKSALVITGHIHGSCGGWGGPTAGGRLAFRRGDSVQIGRAHV